MATLNAGDGIDGNATASSDINLNASSLVGRAYPDMVAYEVTAVTSNGCTINGTPNGISVDDYVLLINLQGAGTSQTDNVGNWEILKVGGTSGSNISFTSSKVNNYGDNGGDTNIGLTNETNHTVMLQRIPQYDNLTVDNGVTISCYAWNLDRYGVISIMCKNVLTLNGSISAYNVGYKNDGTGGGNARHSVGGSYGRRSYDAGNYNRPNNQGGGGSGAAQARGGGGAYGADVGGTNGGDPYGDSALNQIFMGSAGGSTYQSYGTRRGMTAGGIVALFCGTLDCYGSIDANADDEPGSGQSSSGSGGGSGGSVLIHAGILDFNASSVTALDSYNGSVGRIALYYNTLVGDTSAVNPTPYEDNTLGLPYSLSGDMTKDGTVRIYTESWDFVSSKWFDLGPWEIGNLPGPGPYHVLADPDETGNNILGYKSVTAWNA